MHCALIYCSPPKRQLCAAPWIWVDNFWDKIMKFRHWSFPSITLDLMFFVDHLIKPKNRMETWKAQKRVVYRPRFGRLEAPEDGGEAFIGLSAGWKKTRAGIRIFCKVCKNWLHFEEDELRGLTFAKCIPQNRSNCAMTAVLFTNELWRRNLDNIHICETTMQWGVQKLSIGGLLTYLVAGVEWTLECTHTFEARKL